MYDDVDVGSLAVTNCFAVGVDLFCEKDRELCGGSVPRITSNRVKVTEP